MRARMVCTFVAALGGVPGSALAADPPASGVEIGIRGGYLVPFGSRVQGEPLDRTVDRAIPVYLDLGYRLAPNLYVGVLASYARLALDKAGIGCNTQFVDGPGDCWGAGYRIAADVQWRVPLGLHAVGWAAGGAGIEWITLDFQSGCFGGRFERTDSGFELGHVELGGGWRVEPRLVIGPFVSYAAGLYRTSTARGSGCNGGGDIPDKSVHGSLVAGLRASFTAP
jgi:hypothetical protein